jgi:hypothetical protein
MQRVLSIEPAQPGNRGQMQHVAVKEEFEKAVQDADAGKGDCELPRRREQLRVPRRRRNEAQQRQQSGERQKDGRREQREGEFFMFGSAGSRSTMEEFDGTNSPESRR